MTEAFDTLAYQEYLNEGRLMAARCLNCDALILPPRRACPNCFSDRLEWAELSGEGRLEAFTAIHVAPTAMLAEGFGRQEPYCVGVVRLNEGPAISAQIFGVTAGQPQEIFIGLALKAKYIHRGAGGNSILAFEKHEPGPA